MKSLNITLAVIALAVVASLNSRVSADPLSGEVLKFQQLPLDNGALTNPAGLPIGVAYPGHDEWSTAIAVAPNNYQGTFMADDFSDKVSTPIYHISWWGSYDQNQNLNPAYTGNVTQFLVSFESDTFDPSLGPNGASRPDQVLYSEVINAGALAPQSGTFTESLFNGNVPEHIYKYNAELKVPFPEQANTIYWLKIVALVNGNAAQQPVNWGWHDRDWSLTNNLFGNVAPGEQQVGTLTTSAGPTPVWHFQDDSVSGRVSVTQNTAGTGWNVQQAGYNPENYIYQLPGAIGVDGPQGIQSFSKDLAFELYTRPTPEPGTLIMLGSGAVGLGFLGLRNRRKK